MCTYVFEICAEGIFITFPSWLENVKSRSKIALFSNECHYEIWFPKKRTITFFWSKLPNYKKKKKKKKKRPNFACSNFIFPKTRGNNNKPRTHSTSLNVYDFATPLTRQFHHYPVVMLAKTTTHFGQDCDHKRVI